jgi:urease accessory protein
MASRVQGRTLIASAGRIFPSPALDAVQAQASRLCAHAAPLTGVVFASLGVGLETAQRLVLYSSARGVLSAAVRLGITGSYDAHRLQAESAAWMASVQARHRDADARDLAQTAPLIDIFQGAHDRLYSRLFNS